MDPIPHSRPCVGEAEAEAARQVVLGGAMSQGAEVEAFEAEVAARLGRRHAVAVSSGTTGLQLALAALGVEGKRVAVPSYACSALLHAVWAAGAVPRLCDIEGTGRTIDPGLAPLLKEEGVDVVVVVHAFGLAAAVDAFAQAGLRVVEDCAMALGAPGVGSLGTLAVCSFYATKVICSGGEGGMVLCDDDELASRVQGLRQYDGLPASRPRINGKLNDIAAAIGRVQLRRLDSFVTRRRALAEHYRRALEGLPLGLPKGAGHIYFRYVVRCPEGAEEMCRRLDRAGVAARRPVWRPLHREIGDGPMSCPRTEEAWERDVSLPLYPALGDADAARVVEAVRGLYA